MSDLLSATWQRGPIQEKIDRETGDSQPLPDELITAIAAAGLTGHDSGRRLDLYRSDKLTAYVHGTAAHAWSVDPILEDGTPIVGPSEGEVSELWWTRYGIDTPGASYGGEPGNGARRWRNHLDAVRYVLAYLDAPCFSTTKLTDGRWRRGPMTATKPGEFDWIDDDFLVTAAAAGVELTADWWTYTGTRGDVDLGSVTGMCLDAAWLLQTPTRTAVLDDRHEALRALITAPYVIKDGES